MTRPSSRLLGLDFGKVRIGLALSDPLGWTAQPIETLRRVGDGRDAKAILAVAQSHDVSAIVIGLPLLMSGVEGEAAAAVRAFAARLAAGRPDLELVFWDERLSTAEAERIMIHADLSRKRRRERVDAVAAVLILQNYLDARASERSRDVTP